MCQYEDKAVSLELKSKIFEPMADFWTQLLEVMEHGQTGFALMKRVNGENI